MPGFSLAANVLSFKYNYAVIQTQSDFDRCYSASHAG